MCARARRSTYPFVICRITSAIDSPSAMQSGTTRRAALRTLLAARMSVLGGRAISAPTAAALGARERTVPNELASSGTDARLGGAWFQTSLYQCRTLDMGSVRSCHSVSSKACAGGAAVVICILRSVEEIGCFDGKREQPPRRAV